MLWCDDQEWRGRRDETLEGCPTSRVVREFSVLVFRPSVLTTPHTRELDEDGGLRERERDEGGGLREGGRESSLF